MNKSSQQKAKTTLGGFPFIPSRKREYGPKTFNTLSNEVLPGNDQVIGEEELLQFWWKS